jgi:C-terminal processing protease CtpA/Prc
MKALPLVAFVSLLIAQAPTVVRPQTAVDLDHEFDEGSRIVVSALSPAQVDNLVMLAKVWGFLKYHHPAVAQAQHHWDYELFRAMPAVLDARDRAAASRAMVAWIDRIGEPAACNPCASLPNDPALQPPVAWIRDRERLGDELAGRLQRVYQRRPVASEQHYVSFAPVVRNPRFENEAAYAQLSHPDAGYRLLALFRFWNVVEYWFPYRDLIDGSWDDALAEFVPRVALAADAPRYQRALMELAARVGDGHAGLAGAGDNRPPTGECRLPVALRYVERKFVVHAYADSSRRNTCGLERGDVILAIDGQPVDSLVAAIARYYGASNETARMHRISFRLTNGTCGPCEVRVERDGVPVDVLSRREPKAGMNVWAGATHDLPGPTFQLLPKNVAYFKLSTVSRNDARGYIERALGTRGLIIDIRNYPGAFMPFELGGHLVSEATPFARFTRGDATNPGAFLWTEAIRVQPLLPRYEGKVVILVDEASVSQSEYTAMAFRAVPGAIVMGSETAGADGNVSSLAIPGGLKMAMSGIGVFYPDRRPTQLVGIVPDIVVVPTLRGIRGGVDEVLDAAVRHIAGE